jgi:glycine cleavage system aminomethyltransferase T
MKQHRPTEITYGARLRPSPYFESTLEAGVTAFTVYNHMLMPVSYGDDAAAYRTLVDGVSVWDVGAQRQVEIVGPDAAAFTQYLVSRDVSRIAPGRARYTLVCREDGGILNDPVLLRLGSDRFWLSLADSDILLWARGVAHGSGMDVAIDEPDVAPLQVQGPRSADALRPLAGSVVDELPFYGFAEIQLEGVPLVLARTGWSGELGYELFLCDGTKGGWLWERVFEAGRPFGVRPGGPNHVRRLETGLLSYGTDMDASMNPFELGLDRFVDLDGPDDFIGRAALTRIMADGPARRRVGLLIEGDPITQGPVRWWKAIVEDEPAGVVTSAAWSPSVGANIAFAVLAVEHARAGVVVGVEAGDQRRTATTVTLPFIEPRYRG